MKVVLRKCGICHTWYKPVGFHMHCAVCGAVPVQMRNKTVYYNIVSMRIMKSVSAKCIPSNLFAQ